MSGVALTVTDILRRAAALCLSTGFALCQVSPVVRNAAPGVAYVGSEVCGGCHGAILESFRKTGMARSMSVPRLGPRDGAGPHTEPLFETLRQKESRVTSVKLGRTFEVFIRDGDLYQSESRTDANQLVFRTTHRLEYALGSGTHGITFIARRGDHFLQKAG